MTANEAISIHMQWRMTLKLHLFERTPIPADKMDRIFKQGNCVIGQWLLSAEAARRCTLPEYAELDLSHKLFHKEMMCVATLINEGRISEAEKLLMPGGNFEIASKRIANAIMAAGRVDLLPH